MSDFRFPLPYLIGIYRKAISEGCCTVDLKGNEEAFRSFKAAFLRARRRNDQRAASIIEPAFYLCTISWVSETGKALIIYDKLPDDMHLPVVESVSAGEREQLLQLAGPATQPEPEPVDSVALVRSLLDKVGHRIEDLSEAPIDPSEIGE